MKISDIEFHTLATFTTPLTTELGFCALIKDFAKEFSTRIEMKQIASPRGRARLEVGFFGGRELCCSTWLTDFNANTLQLAQQLSLNPQKLAGQVKMLPKL
jgi:cell fate regulator YaaT (PSP1 superfamily)